MRINLLTVIVLFIMLLLVACGGMRRIPEGKTFFRKHSVVVHDQPEEYNLSDDQLLSFSRLKPNRRVLWFRFNHTIYLMVNKEKLDSSVVRTERKCGRINKRREAKGKPPKECTSWRMFWAYTVGEPTVLLDSVKVEKGAQQMHVYLQKKGYFQNRVVPEIIYNENHRRCKVHYNIYPGEPYHIRKIRYTIMDKEMAWSEAILRSNSQLDSAMVFDTEKLDAEREYIANFYNNKGYYDFNKEYIVYDVDSSLKDRMVDINLKLELPKEALIEYPDSLVSVPHKKYFIGDIYVHTDYSASSDYAPIDTIEFDGLKILSNGKPAVTQYLISCIQGYNTGDLYQKIRLDQTYKRYSQLGVFRATTIQLVPKTQSISKGINVLDTHIRLTPAKKELLTIEPQVTNRSGNMGIYGNLLYTHKNLFGGAEAMDVKIIAGLEASQTLVQTSSATDATGHQIKNNFKLNTFEIGPELTFRIPRLWPLGCDFTKLSSEPQTAVSAALNYQRRPDYERTLSQLRLSYSFIENPDKVTKFNIDAIEFSIIKIQKSEAFQDWINKLNDVFLANSYNDHLIMAFVYPTFTLNTQRSKYQRHVFYWRTGAGGAGNLLNGVMSLTDAQQDTAMSYRIAGIRYAQYFRGESDARYYFEANEKNAFVLRAYGGIGVPRKNAITLPFEKSFFSGGSNGLRAWQARTLGPGSHRDNEKSQTFNNIGEIKLEGNIEYRFKMTKMFNLALFLDAGNIWLIHPDPIRPGADFKTDRFLGEIAIGSGIGLRLNFEIFLVRLDLGVQMKDPAKVQGERWIWEPKEEYKSYLASVGEGTDRIPMSSNLVFNLGIGFPF